MGKLLIIGISILCAVILIDSVVRIAILCIKCTQRRSVKPLDVAMEQQNIEEIPPNNRRAAVAGQEDVPRAAAPAEDLA